MTKTSYKVITAEQKAEIGRLVNKLGMGWLMNHICFYVVGRMIFQVIDLSEDEAGRIIQYLKTLDPEKGAVFLIKPHSGRTRPMDIFSQIETLKKQRSLSTIEVTKMKAQMSRKVDVSYVDGQGCFVMKFSEK